jgi:hypothetical protein
LDSGGVVDVSLCEEEIEMTMVCRMVLDIWMWMVDDAAAGQDGLSWLMLIYD